LEKQGQTMPYEYKAKFKKVIDGDTLILDIDLGFNIVLSNQTVRLIGIDTPESRSKDKIEKIFGILSKKAVEEFMKAEDKLIIQTVFNDDNEDKFGRILGKIITSSKVCLNDWLIDHNYAVLYKGENKELVKQAHLKNRKTLIDNKIVQISYAEAGII
jgi:micrococcal nuclease